MRCDGFCLGDVHGYRLLWEREYDVCHVQNPDTTAPVIELAASDSTLECDGMGNTDAWNAWLESNGGAMASDACSGVLWSFNYAAVNNGCGGTGSALVTFTATDSCGNASVTSATVTIEDTTAPTMRVSLRTPLLSATAWATWMR